MLFIREARKAKGITMKELGEMIGCSEACVSHYEREKRQPDYETLLKIAEALDTSMDYLVRGDQSGIKKQPVTEDDELVLDAQEKAFILWLRSLPPEKRQAVLNFQDMF